MPTSPTWEETSPISVAPPSWEETKPIVGSDEKAAKRTSLRGQMAQEERNAVPGQIVESALGAPAAIGHAISAPLVNLYDNLSGQTVRNARDYATQNPLGVPSAIGRALKGPMFNDYEESNPPQVPQLGGEKSNPPTKSDEIAAGVLNVAGQGANTATSPLGLATLGMGALPAAAGRAVSAGFAGQMLSDLPAQIGTASVDSGDTQQNVENIGAPIVGGVFAGMAGHGAMKPQPSRFQTDMTPYQEFANKPRQTLSPETPTFENTKPLEAANGTERTSDNGSTQGKHPETLTQRNVDQTGNSGGNEVSQEAGKPSEQGQEKAGTVELRPGERMVTIQKPDGTTYQAAFGDKYWEGFPGNPAQIATPVEGGWSHGMLPVGDKILETKSPTPEAKPAVEVPQAGEMVAPETTAAAPASETRLTEEQSNATNPIAQRGSVSPESQGANNQQEVSSEAGVGNSVRREAQGAISTHAQGEVGKEVERVKLKGSPQGYPIIDRPAPSPLEIKLKESPIRIKNEKTGEVQIVQESQLQKIKPKLTGMGGAIESEFSRPTTEDLLTGRGEGAAPKSELPAKPETETPHWSAPLVTRLKGEIGTIAGKSMPKTTLADRLSGEYGVRMASSRIAAEPKAKAFVNDTLRGLKVNPVQFDAALKADNLLDIRDRFIRENKHAAAAAVNVLIGLKHFPFVTEQQLQNYFKRPEVLEAVSRHIENWNNLVEPLYRETMGIDPNAEIPSRGKYSGARVNLNPVQPEMGRAAGPVVGGSSGNLSGTMKRRDPFARQAKGTGEQYVLNYENTMANTFARRLEIANKVAFDNQLVASGNAIIADRGQHLTLPDGSPTKVFPYVRKGFDNKDIYVRELLKGEYTRATNAEINPFHGNVLVGANNVLNKVSMVGLTEPTVHIQNQISALLQVPDSNLGSVHINTALSLAGRADVAARFTKLAIKNPPEFLNVLPVIGDAISKRLESNAAQIASLSEIGAMKGTAKHGGPILSRVQEAVQKGGPMGKAAHALEVAMTMPSSAIAWADKSSRLALDDTFKALVKEGILTNTETNRREFVNQVGQYNLRLQGAIVRSLRQTGISPFITAGRNFTVLAVRGMTMNPGAEATSMRSAAALRANMLSKWVGTGVLVGTLNYLLTGKPMGRPGTPLGYIDTGKDDHNGKHLAFGLANLTAQGRAMRATGVRGTVEAKRMGVGTEEAIDSGTRDIINSVLSPLTGPAVKFATIAATGSPPAVDVNPVVYPVAHGENQRMANLKGAVIEANPIASSIHEYTKPGGTITDALSRQLPRLTLTPNKSDQTADNFGKIVDNSKDGRFIDGVINQARGMEPQARAQFVIDALHRVQPDYVEHAIRTLKIRKIMGPWSN